MVEKWEKVCESHGNRTSKLKIEKGYLYKEEFWSQGGGEWEGPNFVAVSLIFIPNKQF